MTPEQNPYQEDEIDLKQLFRSLADRKWFIFGFTGFITVLPLPMLCQFHQHIKPVFLFYHLINHLFYNSTKLN